MQTPPRDSAAVRDLLVGALRLDLIGPQPNDDEALQHERLPQAPSRWYLTGFLVPSDAPEEQRVQDTDEEVDEPVEPTQGADDAREPERGSGKRAFPSILRLLRLACPLHESCRPAETLKLSVWLGPRGSGKLKA